MFRRGVFFVSKYIPDVSRAVFGLLTAMQKRTLEAEDGAAGGSSSKRARPTVDTGATSAATAKVSHVPCFNTRPSWLLKWTGASQSLGVTAVWRQGLLLWWGEGWGALTDW